MHTPGNKISGYVSLLVVQTIFLAIYWIYVRYNDELLPVDKNAKPLNDGEKHEASYAHFQDIQAMIFVGFGFLMTFLKKYGYSATGYTLFLAALVIQWSLIVKGCFRIENGLIRIGVDNIIDADIAAAVPLISMGALLGRTSPIQLLFMAIIEVALFATNEFIQLDILKITDVGGSITVHAFGAYFGLAVSFILRPSKDENDAGKNEGSTPISDLFAMIGTLFLWIYWPSFNSVLADGNDQHRAIVNTYLALGSATVTTFIISAIVSHENKLDMVHVQNSTLAGGVAVGSVCNLLIGPHGAILVGMVAGVVSVLGYRYLTPLMTSHLRIHDSCGVHNLHGMPAVLSALFSIIYAMLATRDAYKDTLYDIFPAMTAAPIQMNSTNTSSINGTAFVDNLFGSHGRTALQQGGYQALGILITVLFAIAGGLITGLLLKTPNVRKLNKDEHHLDEIYWEVPEEKEQYNVEIMSCIQNGMPSMQLSKNVNMKSQCQLMPSVENTSLPPLRQSPLLARSQTIYAHLTIEKLLKRVRDIMKNVINLHIDILVLESNVIQLMENCKKFRTDSQETERLNKLIANLKDFNAPTESHEWPYPPLQMQTEIDDNAEDIMKNIEMI